MTFVDLKEPIQREPLAVALAQLMGDTQEIERIGEGQYLTSLNHGLNMDLSSDEQYPQIGEHYEPCPYGVVDSPEQFNELFGEVIAADPRPMFVTFTPIFREDQPEEGGWRWHKWGPYYGDQNSQEEYLYDEEDIDLVFIYHIYLHATVNA